MSFVVDVSVFPSLFQAEKQHQLTLNYSNADINVTVHDIKTAAAAGNIELLSYVLYYRGNPVDDQTKVSDLRVCSRNQDYLKFYLMENDIKIKDICTPTSSVTSSTPVTTPYINATPRSFLNLTPTKKKNTTEIPVDVDELSLTAAKKWIDNNNSFDANTDKVIETESSMQLLHEFNCRIHNSVTKSNAPAPRDDLLALNWFDWRILTRYVICFFLFAQGSSYSRMATFLSVSILYFVVEMGLIALIMDRLGHDDDNMNNNDAADQNNLRDADAGVQPNRAAGVRGGVGSLIATYIVNISRNGGRLPREPGVFNDIYSFLMAFVLSLVPNWNV